MMGSFPPDPPDQETYASGDTDDTPTFHGPAFPESPVHLTEAQVFHLQDGDVLAFRINGLTQEQFSSVKVQLQAIEANIEERTGKRIATLLLVDNVEFPVVYRRDETPGTGIC